MKNLIKATVLSTTIMTATVAMATVDEKKADFSAITSIGFPVDQSIELVGTGLEGLHLLKIGSDWVVGAEGSTVIMKGQIIDLSKREEITSSFKAPFNKKIVEEFPEDLKIKYLAEGKTKAVINVLTDTSCPFCKKLHDELPKLAAAGVQVNYIPFARGYTKGKGYKQMMSVWCAEDKNKALDDMFQGKTSDSLCLTQAVAQGYKASVDLGATGTPAIYLEDGFAIEGYAPAEKLLKKILK